MGDLLPIKSLIGSKRLIYPKNQRLNQWIESNKTDSVLLIRTESKISEEIQKKHSGNEMIGPPREGLGKKREGRIIHVWLKKAEETGWILVLVRRT